MIDSKTLGNCSYAVGTMIQGMIRWILIFSYRNISYNPYKNHITYYHTLLSQPRYGYCTLTAALRSSLSVCARDSTCSTCSSSRWIIRSRRIVLWCGWSYVGNSFCDLCGSKLSLCCRSALVFLRSWLALSFWFGNLESNICVDFMLVHTLVPYYLWFQSRTSSLLCAQSP